MFVYVYVWHWRIDPCETTQFFSFAFVPKKCDSTHWSVWHTTLVRARWLVDTSIKSFLRGLFVLYDSLRQPCTFCILSWADFREIISVTSSQKGLVQVVELLNRQPYSLFVRRLVDTGWKRPIKCLKLRVIFRKRATDKLVGPEPPRIAGHSQPFLPLFPRGRTSETSDLTKSDAWDVQFEFVQFEFYTTLPYTNMWDQYTPLSNRDNTLPYHPHTSGPIQWAHCNCALQRSVAARPGLFCGKWPIKIRHPMHLRHPVRVTWLPLLDRDSFISSTSRRHMDTPPWYVRHDSFKCAICLTHTFMPLHMYDMKTWLVRKNICAYVCVRMHMYACVRVYMQHGATRICICVIVCVIHVDLSVVTRCKAHVHVYENICMCMCVHVGLLVVARRHAHMHVYSCV